MNSLNPSRKPAAVRPAGGYRFLLAGLLAVRVTQAAGLAATNTPAAIPWNQIGAKAGANYQGDGLAVTPTAQGARLRCVFQRLEGEATPEGLWLTSTATNAVKDRLRVVAVAVGRVADGPLTRSLSPSDGERVADRPGEGQLPRTGSVSVGGQTVRFTRPGLVEEYRVSLDGVRQDFLVPERPAGAGELAVRLAVSGARVEPAAAGARPVRYPQQIEEAEHGRSLSHGARLVLDNSGRKLAYSRLRVTDATGRELAARIEIGQVGDEVTSLNSSDLFGSDIQEKSLLTPAPTSGTLVVVVNDAEAVYPVRIDPTFSDANWISMGGVAGVDGQVYTMAVDSAGNVYIAGDFTVVNDIIATNIAKWNGSSWSALGSGASYEVDALAVSGSDLYVGGLFTMAGGVVANGIAKWDGNTWSALGSGMSYNSGLADVYALAVSGSDLYVGGDFTAAGGIAATNIAKWDGNSWSALGSGMDGVVAALAVSGGTLYAGGGFTTAGGSAANYIAKWDGSSWSALGSGMNERVIALAVSGSTLYAGGFFTTAGDSPASYVAQWDGSSWTDVGFGVSGGYYFPGVWALAASGNNLFVGGIFEMAGDTAVNNIAQWDGSSWSALDSGMSGDANGDAVYALAVSDSTLFAGGLFSTAGDSAASNIAQWDGSSWSEVGFGGSVESYVYALAASGSNVYVGGYFTTAGGTTANNIAMWNGSSWSALGWGIDGSVYSQVYALAVSGSDLYVGGGFTTAGGITANNIAKWDGSSWSALGSGMLGEGIDGGGPSVFALAVSGGTLYAGGDFSTAGGVSARNIAQWNGSSWSALGSGIGIGGVDALAVSGGTLYAGGGFTTAGGNSANNVAQWNGSSWSALGSGISGAGSDGEGPSVDALAVSGSTLYAGGDFSTAGGNPAANIAKWDGNSWSALGSGITTAADQYGPYVYALAVSGSTLYAGGQFNSAGDIAANNIAKWDGSSWSALGSGVNSTVSALAVSGAGSDLYAGGQFTTAGGKLSYYLARAILRLPSLTLRQTNSSTVAVSWPSPSPGFVLQQNSDGLGSGNWSNVTDSMLDDGTNKMITQPMGTNRFFRLVLP